MTSRLNYLGWIAFVVVPLIAMAFVCGIPQCRKYEWCPLYELEKKAEQMAKEKKQKELEEALDEMSGDENEEKESN